MTEKTRAARPKDAAALILIDGWDKKNPKILFGKRNGALKFMPNKFVFPGGRLEPADRRMAVAGALDSRVEARLLKGRRDADPNFARALALCAIRECFEETGHVVGTDDYGGPDKAPACWSGYAAQNCLPELDGLHLIARAITPPMRPRRFDTRFFAVDAKAIRCKIAGVARPDAELTELVWAPLEKIAGLDLPDVTRMVLAALTERREAGMSPFLPAPYFHFSRGKWRRDLL